jgi:hypothetical protein
MAVLVDEQMKLPDERYTRSFQSKWSVRVPDLVVQACIIFVIIIGIQQPRKAIFDIRTV